LSAPERGLFPPSSDDACKLCEGEDMVTKRIRIRLESMPPHTVLCFRDFWGFDSTPWLSEIEAPTLIVVGKDDRVCTLSMAEEMHRLIPNSRLLVLEDCGHIPMYEKREELNRALEEFIEGE